jgi:hypothetical protein
MIDILAATNAVQSLSLANTKPMCPDHRPVGKYVWMVVDEDRLLLYEVTCPNCNFHAFVHPDAVEELR